MFKNNFTHVFFCYLISAINNQQQQRGKNMFIKLRTLLVALVTYSLVISSALADAITDLAKGEFSLSTISEAQRIEELKWFQKAATPFKGMSIKVVSEGIPTHEYESKVLTKAFEQVTGIKVSHQIIGEGDVVMAVQTQMQTDVSIYDAYVNDSDLIGTHARMQKAVNLTDWMAGEGKDVTLPTLDLKDFIGLQFTTGPDGKLYQLPDQQFANLYWFRKDWFDKPEIKAKFKAKYKYDLGVPLNWSAYEDIAAFFTNDVKEINGVKVYGHMDYGKRAPDLGWRMTDAWLSMAGAGDKSLPNGIPVDEWGIRMEKGTCNPVGASVTRGGATNGPAAVYAIRKWDEWLRAYAPPGAAAMDFYQSLPSLSSGNVAQQIFWYTAFTASLVGKNPNNKVVDANGMPLWRMGPSPKGPYWEEGMKLGYQDVGSWTLFKSTPVDRRKAAWLYAQFTVSKTVSLKKAHVGLTIIRNSDVNHASFTKRMPELGGLIEFYRSPNRNVWSPTGINVPDYPKLAQLWWQHIGEVNSGTFTAQQTMDRLAEEMDLVMSRMEAADKESKAYGGCGPRLNPVKDTNYWLKQPGAPKEKRNEKPAGKTVPYEKAWG
jgi:glycerol transport system substrate-binding protein